MENEKTLDETKETDAGTQPHPSEDKPTEEYPKPWMRQLGNKYYNNEQLTKYDSLSQMVDDLLTRPERKNVPEKYELREGTDEMFRKAGLTKKEAEEIDAFYGKMIPERQPDLKEALGEAYDKTMEYYADAEKTFSELGEEIRKQKLNENPVFVKVMSVIGREMKGKPFVPPRDSSKKKSYKELYAESFSRKQ